VYLLVIVSVHHNGRTKCRWRRWLWQGDDVVYILGRVVSGRSGGKVMLPGWRKDCVWVKENMGVLEVLRIVEEAMREGVRGWRMWYSLKCNRLELLPLG